MKLVQIMEIQSCQNWTSCSAPNWTRVQRLTRKTKVGHQRTFLTPDIDSDLSESEEESDDNVDDDEPPVNYHHYPVILERLHSKTIWVLFQKLECVLQ